MPSITIPVVVEANIGETVNLTDIVRKALPGSDRLFFWQDNRSDGARGAGYWRNADGNPKGSLEIRGQKAPYDTSIEVATADLAHVVWRNGADIRSILHIFGTDDTAVRIHFVPRDIYVDPTPSVIDASDVVNAAIAFGGSLSGSSSPFGCVNIAMAITGSISAIIPWDSQSTKPSENREGLYWKIAYRGDQAPDANWQSQVKAGDVIRLELANGTPHMLVVIANQAGRLETVDNYYGSSITRHATDFQSVTKPQSVTIYRLDTQLSEEMSAVKSLYESVLRAHPTQEHLLLLSAQIESGTYTRSAHVSKLVEQAQDSVAPALSVYAAVYGVTPNSAQLDLLSAFVEAQIFSPGYQSTANPRLGGYEAMGLGLSRISEFTAKFGAGPDTNFITSTYSALFGQTPTASQLTHFLNQVGYFEGLYRSVGIPPSEASNNARGAALGQMIGLAAEAGADVRADVNAWLHGAANGQALYGTPLELI